MATTASAPAQSSNWAQRVAAAAVLPLQKSGGFQQVGKGSKAARKPTGQDPIQPSIPSDERVIAFEMHLGAL